MVALEYEARGQTPNQLIKSHELETGLLALLMAYKQMQAWHKDGWFIGGISADHILMTLTEYDY